MSITSKLNKVYAKVGIQITDPKRFWICYWCNLAITIFIQAAAKAYVSKTTKDEETSRATERKYNRPSYGDLKGESCLHDTLK